MARRESRVRDASGEAHLPWRPRRDSRALRTSRARLAATSHRGHDVNRVNAPDGTPLVFDAYEPSRAGAAVLFLHDWHPTPEGLSEQWAGLGAQLREAGFAAYFLEQRGHGRSGGRRGHLSRFSQLLGDLQAFRRAVRRRVDIPQVLVGHGFGGLVVLRYLETQPGEPPAAAVLSGPWLAPRKQLAIWKRLAAKLA